MIIKMDYRETELHNECMKTLCNYKNITIITENLPIGDIIICNDDGVESIIIERKSLNDLASSIRDGRYNEQSYRLDKCDIHNHNIIYLIEGVLSKYKPKITGHPTKTALLSSMVSINHFKGFSLYRTTDTSESAEWILNMADKLCKKNKAPYYNNSVENVISTQLPSSDNSISNEKEYIDVSKRAKKNNITIDNIGEIMLSQIPGVSTSISIVILNEFHNIKNVISSLENDSKALDNLMLSTKTGKSRKISKTAINNIYKYLIHNK